MIDLFFLDFNLFDRFSFLLIKNIKYKICVRRAIVIIKFIFFLIFAESVMEVIIIKIY